MRFDLDPGSLLGEYRIEAVIGRGGTGTVYRAVRTRLDQTVALKVLLPGLAEDAHFRGRFEREWRTAVELRHPNILPVLDAGEADGLLFQALPFIEDGDLAALLVREGPLDGARALRLLGQVASALDAAHARGLVHRDVKPGNILVVPGSGPEPLDHPYLADFGVAKRTDSQTGLTRMGSVVGSPHYLAPEQIEPIAGHSIDGRADVYALGIVLYECLTGRVPFEGDTDWAILHAHLNQPLPSLRPTRPELARALDPVLAAATAKHPRRRHVTAGTFIATARAALAPGPDPAHPSRLQAVRARIAAAAARGRVPAQSAPASHSKAPTEPAPPPVGQRTRDDPLPGETEREPATPPPPRRSLRTPALIAAGVAAVLLVAGVGMVVLGVGGPGAMPTPTPEIAQTQAPQPIPTQIATPTPDSAREDCIARGGRWDGVDRVCTLTTVETITPATQEPPTPAPRVLLPFFDDFSEESGDWYVGRGSGWERAYRSGGYLMRTGGWSDQAAWLPSFDEPLMHVRVEVSARRTEGAPELGGYGVFCRGTDTGQYTFVIRADGRYLISKWSPAADGDGLSATTLADGYVDRGFPAGTRVAGTCLGRNPVELVLYADGVELASAVDAATPIATGTVGVGISSFDYDEVISVVFDDFFVDDPT